VRREKLVIVQLDAAAAHHPTDPAILSISVLVVVHVEDAIRTGSCPGHAFVEVENPAVAVVVNLRKGQRTSANPRARSARGRGRAAVYLARRAR
jgi:hypothetical protein